MPTPRHAAAICFALAVVSYPILFRSDFAIGAAITVAGYAAGTVGFVLLLGLAHQLAIGQAAFYMIGGYGSAILTSRYGWDGLSAMLLSAAVAVVIAAAVGLPLLKLRGFVLAIASLALHLLFISLAILLTDFTGGASGIPSLPRFSIGTWVFTSDLAYYALAWSVVGVMLAIGQNIDRSRIGRALRALASDESAAVACGIDTTHYKLLIFAVSAGMASIGGSLLAHYIRVMDPSVFGMQFSLDIVTAVIVGGLHSVWGAVIGAIAIIALHEALRSLHQPAFEVILVGLLTIVALIRFPSGIVGAICALYDWLPGAVEAVPERDIQNAATAPLRIEARGARGEVMLRVRGVSRAFGKLRAVSAVSFDVLAGEIVALIGPNGAGKTTMLDMISGHQSLDGGAIDFRARAVNRLLPDKIAGAGVARTFQAVRLFENMSVIENVMCGAHVFGNSGILSISFNLPRVKKDERRLKQAAMRELSFVGLADSASLLPGQSPFGHQRMIELARAMALEPSLLLLDEPASGLNDTETEALAGLLLEIRARGVTILLVEHDIRLVMGVADKLVVMDHGELIAEGPTEKVRADPKVISAYLGVAA